MPVNAGQSSGQFNVTVTLLSANSPSAPNAGFCIKGPEPGTLGAVVTIVCATGAVVDVETARPGMPWTPRRGAYRFTHLTDAELPGELFQGVVDSYTGIETMTTWRKVSLLGQDYLEMLVGW